MYDLHEALRLKTKRAQAVPNWPNVEWQDKSIQCHVSSWSAEEYIDDRLLYIRMTEQVGNISWRLKLTLGWNEQIVIQEECEVLPARQPLPVDEVPSLLDCLGRYFWEDADQFEAGRVIKLSKSRAAAFLDFVKAPMPERCLPIILVTPRHADGEYALQHIRELAVQVRGLAHVVVLANETKWYPDDLPLSPATYNGAVRLYMPGYEEGQNASTHRLWMPDRINDLGEPRVIQEIVRLVHERNALQLLESETIRHLEEMREKEVIKKKVEAELQAAKEVEQKRIQQEYDALRQRLKSQVKAEVHAEFESLFDTLQQDIQRLNESLDCTRAEKESLEADNRKLRDKIRLLKFQVRQQWAEPENVPDQLPAQPILYLSNQVWEVYNGLDRRLRLFVENQLFHKLAGAGLRDSQTEVVTCQGGACYVFPRSRAADGKRVIYILEGTVVKVCELFIHHDQYDAARTRGFDLGKYRDFAPWEPVKVELTVD
jgi:hypothetical protein